MPEQRPRRSPEVEAIVERVLRSFATGDADVMERLASSGPEFRAIGTDPEEWYDAETFFPVMAAQMLEMEGLEVEIRHLEAWELDATAWSAVRVAGRLNDVEFEMRVTAVFVLDRGSWQIVQWHASDGVPNAESIGFELTTTLTEMLDVLDIDSDLADVVGEGMLTLVFTDVADSTAHASALGDRRYAELMAEHLSLIEDHARSRAGRVVKTVGDGALLAFSSARAAVGCAVEIQQTTADAGVPFAVRIGVHAGDVIRTDTDVMGLAVNKAARVTSAADGGQVVVSSVVKELVGADPSFRFGSSFFAELKGIDGIHELVPVEWRASVPTRSA